MYDSRVIHLRPQPDLTEENREMLGLLAQLRQLPLSDPSFRQAMAGVWHHLQTAGRALALACGISSEFRYLPEVWGLPELNIVHGRYLTPMSYHLNSALGAAELLAAGRGRIPHFPLMVGCMLAIMRLWQRFPEAEANLRRAAGPRYAGAVDLMSQTMQTMALSVQHALSITRTTVSAAQWNAAVRASLLSYRVRDKVSESMGEEAYG